MAQAIAIVGMAGRFPGARNLDEFWRNLYDGVEAVRDRSDADLLAAGVTAEELADPDYVRRASMLADVPLFDAGFFGMSPRDASIMDPQHRHFLEVAWEALENAGHVPQSFAGSVGVFAGSGMNTYLIHNLLGNKKLLESAGLFQLKQTGNDKDVLATRVSYQFDLRGPAINIQTACSTSLVAIHLACQSLLNFECDMALAGGVTIEIPHGQGYVYREGEILARDGHCRAFDRESTGTVFGSGLGIVALRRLEDALEEHDTIRAVILGSAINNDGARKVGYLAPSVDGQMEVIAEALDYAGLTADDITYVETHGTGTRVGDPIEVRALTQAFRRTTQKRGYCGIGSLKPSVGHLDAAAGVAGVIKTTLALEHTTLPESLNFDSINPHIELAASPFYVNNRRRPWSSPRGPRRAGVTALGIGGTNAHVLLEEAPTQQIVRAPHPYRLLTVSAKTEAAADQALTNLIHHLEAHADVALADAAFTCVNGRQSFAHRRALVVADAPDAVRKIEAKLAARGTVEKTAPRIAFLFASEDAVRVNTGRAFFEHEAAYRAAFNSCAQAARALLGVDLVATLYPDAAHEEAATETLQQTSVARTAAFAVEYALAAWWRAQGVQPAATAGDAVGAQVAACVNGSMALVDALKAAVDAEFSVALPSAEELAAKSETICIVVGTGARESADARVLRTLPAADSGASELSTALSSLGALWTLGVDVDLAARFKPGEAARIPLPTYPFEHRRYWIESDADAHAGVTSSGEPNTAELLFYQRPWRRVALPAASQPEAARWLLLDAGDALGDRLAAALRATGQDAITVESGSGYKKLGRDRYRLRRTEQADYELLFADLLRDGAAPNKILHLAAVDVAEHRLDETMDRYFNGPLALAQAMMARELSGIDVGFVSRNLRQTGEEPVVHPERAVLDGVARVWPKEQPGTHCRSIDLRYKKGEEHEAAALLIAEMNASSTDAAVAYRNGERWLQTLERYTPSDAPRRTGLVDGGVYLITGGLGALGLVVAQEIAEKAHARLILTGRSATPPEGTWEALAADKGQSDTTRQHMQQLVSLRAHAAGLLCLQADVTDAAAMRKAIEAGEQAFGPLDGVLHVAGVLDDAPIALKSREAAARVLAPKVRGTLALAETLGERKLSSFVLFSSISAVDAPAGQVDYVAANAFLDAFAQSRNGDALAVNWGAWREVGMAARTASPHPWLDEKLLDTDDAVVFSGAFSQQRRWVLSEHRFTNGQALIPGTGYLELAAGAFTRGSLAGSIEFQDVYFLAPFMVSDEEQRELRVQLKREPDAQGVYRFSVFGAGAAASNPWTEHATGLIVRFAGTPAGVADRAAITARCTRSTLKFDDEHRTRQERTLEFGPRWRTLRRLLLGDGEALAELELGAEWCGDIGQLRQHPALLDMATGAALYLTPNYEQSTDLYLPVSYHRLRVFRPLPERLWSHIRMRPQAGQSEVVTFDIVLLDEQNAVLAEIEGFAMRRIRDTASAMKPGGLARAASNGERMIEIPSRSGIASEAGAQALIELLGARTPAVVVAVHEPLRAAAPNEAAIATVAAARVANEAPAASGGLEETLIVWWKEMLGVDAVKPDDDFFTLGGHSLIGVRLFARIKRALGVDLELATLFEARTVRQLAALINSRQTPVAAELKPAQWKALVPVQPKGNRPPLFCVHAVGGDVIFYEQLARALGPEQPFYAFQSPLVADPERRDLSIEKIAALYIEEMRAFYPQGPYLLGGASYGGFVLYEMARQLNARGIEPGLVAMFDVVVPQSTEVLARGEKYARLWQQIRNDGLGYVRRKVTEKLAYFHHSLYEHFAYPVGVKIYRRMGWPMPPALRFNYIAQGHWEALNRYKMDPFPGRITLVRAMDRGPEALGKREDPTLGWGPLALGGLEIVDVPTEHMKMLFDPYVTDFAVTLNKMLERGAGQQ
jgi:acyl transferase domain-containing protein/thioesterase domain-containing protein